MNNKIYAKKLTKEDLIRLGIGHVSEDGHVFDKDGRELKQQDTHSGQKIYKSVFPQGQIIGVHRCVYCWYNNEIPEKLVVDHIDNNPLNNNLSNLQLLTIPENLAKERATQAEVRMAAKSYSREYIVEKLNYYLDIDKTLKETRTATERHAEEIHKNRQNIAN